MSYQPQDFSSPPNRPPPAPGPYILTRDERRVLKECAQESFYRRCVPFMTALGLGAYYGVHLGYLKPNASYGAAPKVAGALVVGFIAGKLSYKQQCEEKILHLPGGKLKESVLMTRQSQDGLWKSLDDGGVYKDASLSYALPPYASGNFSSYEEPRSTSDLGIERPLDSFDDSFKREFSDEIDQAMPTIPPSQSVSYDELRNRNREEYETRRKQYRSGPLDDFSPFSGPYPPLPSGPGPMPAPAPRVETDDRMPRTAQYQPAAPVFAPSARIPGQRKNPYGDIIEK